MADTRRYLVALMMCIALITSNVFAQSSSILVIDDYYQPVSNSCRPSPSCCCSIGLTRIRGTKEAISVLGDLDGGQGCGFFQSLGAIFIPQSPTLATYTVPVYNIEFEAQSNADYSLIHVRRSGIGSDPTCLNALEKITLPAGISPTNFGRFSATATPSVMLAEDETGGFDQEFNHSIKFTLKRLGNTEYYDVYALIHPTTTVTSGGGGSGGDGNSNSAHRVAWMMLYYITPTTASPSTAIITTPTRTRMLLYTGNGTGAAERRQFKASSIRIGDGLGIRFAFSYQFEGNSQRFDTPTAFYTAGGEIGTVSSSLDNLPFLSPVDGSTTIPIPNETGGNGNGGSSTGNGGNNSSNNSNSSSNGSNGSNNTGGNSNGNSSSPPPAVEPKGNAEKWAGTFRFDASKCKTSDSCCCAVNTLKAEYVKGKPNQILLKSQLDGGTSCMSMSDVEGVFNLSSASEGSHRYQDTPLVLKAKLSKDLKTIEFSNNIYSCKSIATRQTPIP